MKIRNIQIDLFIDEKDYKKVDAIVSEFISKNRRLFKDWSTLVQHAEKIKKVKGVKYQYGRKNG